MVVWFLWLPFSLSRLEGGHVTLADRTKTASASLVGLAESALVRFLLAVGGYHLGPTRGDGVLGAFVGHLINEYFYPRAAHLPVNMKPS